MLKQMEAMAKDEQVGLFPFLLLSPHPKPT